MKKKRKKEAHTHTHTVSHLELFFVKIETKEQTIIFLRFVHLKRKISREKKTTSMRDSQKQTKNIN